MLQAPFGIANIEVAFALLYTRLVEEGSLELSDLLRLFGEGPARVMDWPVPSLMPGAPADVVVLDLETPQGVDASLFRTKAKFSPWEGEHLKGWPVATFVRGEGVFVRTSEPVPA